MIYKCEFTNKKFKWAACIFVNDAMYIINREDNNADEVVRITQERQDKLEGLIKATGGAINEDKLKWWMLIFEWRGGAWSQKKKERMNYTINMKARDGSNAILTQKEVNDLEEILGVW